MTGIEGTEETEIVTMTAVTREGAEAEVETDTESTREEAQVQDRAGID